MPSLREKIATILSEIWRRKISHEQIFFNTGSKQALDLVGRTFLNAKDAVIVENPTYFVAISAFNAYGCRYIPISLQNDGPSIDELNNKLSRETGRIKFLYTIPTFQNPTGISWSLEKRKQVLEIMQQQNCIIIEDDPYSDLYFNQAPPPPLYALDSSGKTVYIGTFSKSLAPGLRVGFVVANPELISQLTLIKQSMDLHSPTLSQLIVSHLLSKPDWYRKHLNTLRIHYSKQATALLTLLERHLSTKASWTVPQGGLFVWVKIPGSHSLELLKKAVLAGVAFMPGYPFYAKNQNWQTIRLTFSMATQKQMSVAVQALASCLP